MSRRKIAMEPRSEEPIPVSFLGWEERVVHLWMARQPVAKAHFPPCIQNILSDTTATDRKEGGGSNRAAAFLAAFLGQAGWPEEEALSLWQGFAHAHHIKDSLFRRWFSRMHCPSCQKVKSPSRGYPQLGMGGLGFCQPNHRCAQVAWPVGYGCDHPSGQDDAKGQFGILKCLETRIVARLLDWLTGQEMELEMDRAGRDALARLVADRGSQKLLLTWERKKGRLWPVFQLGEAEEADPSSARRSMLSEQL